MEKGAYIKIFTSTFFVFAFLVTMPHFANAASLYFSPSSGAYAVGATFSVNVYVSSTDQAMNAASGIISFPPDKLEVISLSKTGSIFTLWVQEPSFFNSAGIVNFEGIVLNPGFTGPSGKAITVNFRTKAVGNASLVFSSSAVLANDGKGTNILSDLGNAQFSLVSAGPTVPEPAVPTAVSGTPSAPKISSPTHPDSEEWYSKSDAKFTWNLPPGITGIRLLADKNSDSVPTVAYVSLITSKEIDNLEDGVWYFHARFRNSAGWGGIPHFRFQIDTEPPEPFSIDFPEGKETRNTRPKISFHTTDALSGIDYYEIKINNKDSFELQSATLIEAFSYTLPPQSPGKKTITIKAFDKAGNYTTASDEFTILPPEEPIVEIQKPQFFEFLTGVFALYILIVMLFFIIILLFYLGFVYWRLNRKFENSKKKIKKESQEEAREHIEILKNASLRRGLTNEEEKIFQDLIKNLDDSEKFLKKDVNDAI